MPGGVATMVPSATDLVVALGAADRIVGVSHECDHPAAAGRPVLTRAAVAGAPGPGERPADPGALDAAVAAARGLDEPLYLTDRALLHRLAPDVVVAQDVCDVCAVTGDQVACEVPPGTAVVRLGAVDLAGLRADLRAVGAALGGDGPARAEAAVAELDAALAAVAARVAGRPPVRTLLLEWGEPPFAAGHWVPELLALAGGTDVLGAPGAPSRRVTWDEVEAADPDAVVLLPCGYHLGPALAEGADLLATTPLGGLRAVAEGRAWAVDATRLLSRCTPVAAEAAAVLAGLLHPDVTGPPDPADARPLEAR